MSRHAPFSANPLSEKQPSSLFPEWPRKEYILKGELTDLSWELLGIPYLHRQKAIGFIIILC